MTSSSSPFSFDNTFARQMDGFYTPWQGEPAPGPEIKFFNQELAQELGLNANELNTPDGAAILSGSKPISAAQPLAQVYAGHQFGGFSQQLGDGRALLLGEILDTSGQRKDVQLKGSGKTPYSRGGDGKAVLGPVLREYIMGEAMHALGIPTTRALAVTTTGEPVYRDGIQPGAVLTRVAASHIRVGTFQYFAARGKTEQIKQLADYTIDRHYPDISKSESPYLDFLNAVITAQANLVSQWMLVGFIHGVLNTDNVTISGETIDYGPCAFMDSYNPNTVFSSIDRDGRYAYGNQPTITQWNLARFAETLLPLLEAQNQDEAVKMATEAINGFPDIYTQFWLEGMRRKIGLASPRDGDVQLIFQLLQIMTAQNIDYTMFFRRLADTSSEDTSPVTALFEEPKFIQQWLDPWIERCALENRTDTERQTAMNAFNPIYIPRNHKVEEALMAAWQNNDMKPAQKLLNLLARPYTQCPGSEEYEFPAPAGSSPYKTFCGT